MQQYIQPVIFLAGSFLLLFGFAEYLYHRCKIRAEITRKLVHVGTGLLTLLFPIYLDSQWQVLLLCGSFLALLLASLRFGWLPSINAISRVSYGSILFPVAVYTCYVSYVLVNKGLIIYYLPMLLLAICDTLAAFIGKRFPYGSYSVGKGRKTLSGSMAFFIAGSALSIVLFYLLPNRLDSFWEIVLVSIIISLSAAVVEAISTDGTDNLTIPVGTVLVISAIL